MEWIELLEGGYRRVRCSGRNEALRCAKRGMLLKMQSYKWLNTKAEHIT